MLSIDLQKRLPRLPKKVWIPEDRPKITDSLHFVSKHSWDDQNILDPHSHPTFEFIIIVEGAGTLKTSERRYDLKAGDILVVEPNTEHYGRANPDSPFVLLTLGYKFNLRDISTDMALLGMDNRFLNLFHLYLDKAQQPIIPDDTSVTNTVFKLINEVIYPKPCNQAMIKAYLIQFFSQMIRRMVNLSDLVGKFTPFDEAVMKAQAFMRENYNSSLSLDDIAGVACLSPSHFCRLFKRQTRMTPLEYLNSIRINQAKALLSYTNKTLTEIAEIIGYSGIHYFSRSFKKYERISPIQYRRINRPQ